MVGFGELVGDDEIDSRVGHVVSFSSSPSGAETYL